MTVVLTYLDLMLLLKNALDPLAEHGADQSSNPRGKVLMD